MMTLITGGRDAGKTSTAIKMAKRIELVRYYVATARGLDEEMDEKIKRHRLQRENKFVTVEEPISVAEALKNIDKDSVVVLDCLTMWVANMIFADKEELIFEQADKIIKELSLFQYAFAITNEVSLGIIPENKLSRKYSAFLGEVNKLFAASSDTLLLMIDGLSLKIK